MGEKGSFLVGRIGIAATYELLAEEAAELAHAAQKLARAVRRDNPVFGHTGEELVMNLHEELADVEICVRELREAETLDADLVNNFVQEKTKRMHERLDN